MQNLGYTYILSVLSKKTSLESYISHSIRRSEILSQPVFCDKVNTTQSPWVSCSHCDGLFLWPGCVHTVCTTTTFSLVFISRLGPLQPCSLFRVKNNFYLLLDLMVLSLEFVGRVSEQAGRVDSYLCCSTLGTEGPCIGRSVGPDNRTTKDKHSIIHDLTVLLVITMLASTLFQPTTKVQRACMIFEIFSPLAATLVKLSETSSCWCIFQQHGQRLQF